MVWLVSKNLKLIDQIEWYSNFSKLLCDMVRMRNILFQFNFSKLWVWVWDWEQFHVRINIECSTLFDLNKLSYCVYQKLSHRIYELCVSQFIQQIQKIQTHPKHIDCHFTETLQMERIQWIKNEIDKQKSVCKCCRIQFMICSAFQLSAAGVIIYSYAI